MLKFNTPMWNYETNTITVLPGTQIVSNFYRISNSVFWYKLVEMENDEPMSFVLELGEFFLGKKLTLGPKFAKTGHILNLNCNICYIVLYKILIHWK